MHNEELCFPVGKVIFYNQLASELNPIACRSTELLFERFGILNRSSLPTTICTQCFIYNQGKVVTALFIFFIDNMYTNNCCGLHQF